MNTEILFLNKEHAEFYEKTVNDLTAETYHGNLFNPSSVPDVHCRALIYTLGICTETRWHFNDLYDKKECAICTEKIYATWQTESSLKATRLAFELFADSFPKAIATTFNKSGICTENLDECQKLSVGKIFCCEYAPYFFEAIKIRYPEYFTAEELD